MHFWPFFTSMVDEIFRLSGLTNKNQEYETRLNQLEATQSLASRGQQKQHIFPSHSNSTMIWYFVEIQRKRVSLT